MKKWKKIAAVLMAATVTVVNFQGSFVYAYDTAKEEMTAPVMEKTDDLHYIYVESPYLEAPGSQNIVVSWGDGTEDIQDMSITVARDDGEQEVWINSNREANTYLFTKEFKNSAEHHTYTVLDVNFKENGREQKFLLSELNAEAEFGVNKEYDGYGENVVSLEENQLLESSIVTIDENGHAEAKDNIAEALKEVSGGSQTQKERGGAVVVALDSGHDNRHGGAVNSKEKLIEQELTLKIANYTKAELEQYCGVRVYMTRTTNACPYPKTGKSGECIEQRALAAAKAGAKIYVSFHLNALEGSPYTNGAEVIFPNGNWKSQVGADGKALAQKIQKELIKLGLADRGIYSKDTTVNEKYPDGSSSDYFSVQICNKEHGIPGIIVEHAFITGSSDVNRFLKTEAGLKSLGVADANGIAEFLHLTKGKWEYVNGKGWRFLENGKYVAGTWKYIDAWYYFNAEGYMCTEWTNVYGTWYYLGQDGRMKTDWQYINNRWYYLHSNGAMQKGWRYVRNAWYYMNTDGAMQTGWLEDGKRFFYLHQSGRMGIGQVKISERDYLFKDNGALSDGWQFVEGKYYYIGKDDRKRTGWIYVGDTWYYMNADGIMQTGWLEEGGSTYYLYTSGGMHTGKAVIGGVSYYFDATGRLVKN